MKEILITHPVAVTLRIGEWYWLLGLLTSISSQGENRTLDKLYDQIMQATE